MSKKGDLEIEQSFRLAPLSEPFTNDETRDLSAFYRNFLEFWENFEDLRIGGISNTFSFEFQNGKIHTRSDLGFSRHRIKGFLLDYRKFHQQSEPIHLPKICKMIKRRCKDERLHSAIDSNLNDWTYPKIPTLGWHNEISERDLIESLFNEEFFHVGSGKNVRHAMRDIRERLSEDAIVFSAYNIAYSRLLVIRNVGWILQPALDGSGSLRVPA